MDYQEYIDKIKLDYYLSLAGGILFIIIGCLIAILFITKPYKKIQVMRKINNTVVSVVLITLVIFTFVMGITGIKSLIPDLYNVRNDIYIVDECLVIGSSNSGNPDTYQDRYPKCRSTSSGEEYFLTTFYSPIYEGEIYRVIYLENSKIGRVIEKIQD